MRIDLHIHSRPGTPVGLSSITDQLDAAAAVGLDGVAIVDRGLLRGRASLSAVGLSMPDLRALGAARSLVVFAGAEIPTTRGPLLVYGIEPDMEMRFDQPVEVRGLIDWVRDQDGATVIPHLFRDRSPDQRAAITAGEWDWWLRSVDAFELTWAQDRSEDELILDVARRLRNKGVIQGSDAHYARQVGAGSHDDAPDLQTDAQLVEWLRSFDRRER